MAAWGSQEHSRCTLQFISPFNRIQLGGLQTHAGRFLVVGASVLVCRQRELGATSPGPQGRTPNPEGLATSPVPHPTPQASAHPCPESALNFVSVSVPTSHGNSCLGRPWVCRQCQRWGQAPYQRRSPRTFPRVPPRHEPAFCRAAGAEVWQGLHG